MKYDPAKYARIHAHELQYTIPQLFEIIPIDIPKIIEYLGISLIKQDVTGNSWFERKGEQYTIYIGRQESRTFSRYALAHELGHAFISKKYPDLVRRTNYQWLEFYAHEFASEILVPSSEETTIITFVETFSSTEDILSLVKRYGIIVPTAFKLIKKYGKFLLGRPVVCFRSIENENLKTGLERKYRVYNTCFDNSRYFIPNNQGLDRLIGSSNWIFTLDDGEKLSKDGKIAIYKKNPADHKKKYTLLSQDCTFEVTKLSRSQFSGETFIFLAKLFGG